METLLTLLACVAIAAMLDRRGRLARGPAAEDWRRRVEAEVLDASRRSAGSHDPVDAEALRTYVRTAARVIPAAALSSAPVSDLPAATGRRLDYAKGCVRLAVLRFGMTMPRVKIRFAPLQGRGGRVRVTRDGAWAVDVDPEVYHDHERILAIIAHEVAHIALLGRGIELQPLQRNEELTDAATVLAGFGSVMLSCVLREQVIARDDEVRAFHDRLGYLTPRAIAHLAALRVEMAGGDAAFYREHVALWQHVGIDDYLAARDAWSAEAAGARGRRVACFACGTPMGLPAASPSIRVRCPGCTLRVVVPAR